MRFDEISQRRTWISISILKFDISSIYNASLIAAIYFQCSAAALNPGCQLDLHTTVQLMDF